LAVIALTGVSRSLSHQGENGHGHHLSHPRLHSTCYTADAVCDLFDGLVGHEAWCITRNPEVLGAGEAVDDSATLSVHDQLILHALGGCVDGQQQREMQGAV
jgi:hypothetical protein